MNRINVPFHFCAILVSFHSLNHSMLILIKRHLPWIRSFIHFTVKYVASINIGELEIESCCQVESNTHYGNNPRFGTLALRLYTTISATKKGCRAKPPGIFCIHMMLTFRLFVFVCLTTTDATRNLITSGSATGRSNP